MRSPPKIMLQGVERVTLMTLHNGIMSFFERELVLVQLSELFTRSGT